jgi:TPR repeat protein
MRWLDRARSISGARSRRERREQPLSADRIRAEYERGRHRRLVGYRHLAVRPLRRAAEAGHPAAAYELSLVLGGRERRLAWRRRAAELAREQGRPATQVAFYLHKAVEDGQAEDVLRQAAENGDRDAAFDLGKILETGWPDAMGRVPTRAAEAERYYLIAYKLGHVEAALRLGLMLTGAGRREEGERYIRLAADLGNPVAARRAGDAARKAGHDQDAERYLRTAARAGRFGASDDILAYAEFLGRRGRIHEALPLLRELGEDVVSPRLETIDTMLRKAGLKEAEEYRKRAAELERALDTVDSTFD